MPSKFYYSAGGASWTEETAWYQISISDTIVNRNRIAEILVSNPRNTKQSNYTAYLRCKIVESGVNATTFLGRVISSDPFYDETYGQSVKIVISDYISDLFERKVNVDYSSSAWKRSQIISQLITDYSYSGNIIKDIDPSASSQTVSKNYLNSNQTPIQIIEGLAQEDPWDDTPTGYGYDYYVDDTQTFQYFKRGSQPAVGSALIIQLGGVDSVTVRPMLHDYSLCDAPKEIVTRVTCYGIASDGTRQSYTATSSSMESTLHIIKEKVDFVWGSNMSAATLLSYVTNRAKALLNAQGGTINRGKFKFYRYPYVGSSASLVRVGDVVNVICSPQSISGSYLTLSVKYSEPPGVTEMEVVSLDKGREFSPFELSSVLQGLQRGREIIVSAAQISDLVVDSAHINSLEANKVIINGSITLGDWRAASDLSKFDGADVYDGSLSKTGLNFAAFDKDLDNFDNINNGTAYGKLLVTQINAGRIQLTASNYYATKFSGTWYSMGTESGIDIDSVAGINIYGKDNALTTRATKTGTIQCYVGSDGKIYAGGGNVWLDADGVRFTGAAGVARLMVYTGSTYMGWVCAANQGLSIGATVGGGGVLLLEGDDVVFTEYANVTWDGAAGDVCSGSNTSGQLGTTSYYWGKLWVMDISIGTSGNIIMTGNIGNTTYYPANIYCNTLHYITLDASPWQDYDDVGILRAVKLDSRGKIDFQTFHPDLLATDIEMEEGMRVAIKKCQELDNNIDHSYTDIQRIKREIMADAEIKATQRPLDLGKFTMLLMGSILKLDDRIKLLESEK